MAAAPSSALAKLEAEIGSVRSRHSRRLTLRAAVALLDRLEKNNAKASASTPTTGPVEPSADSGVRAALPTADLNASAPSTSASGAGAAPALVRNSSFSWQTSSLNAPSSKSVALVLKGLIGKVVELRGDLRKAQETIDSKSTALAAALEQVGSTNAQLKEAMAKVDALEADNVRLRKDLVDALAPPSSGSAAWRSPNSPVSGEVSSGADQSESAQSYSPANLPGLHLTMEEIPVPDGVDVSSVPEGSFVVLQEPSAQSGLQPAALEPDGGGRSEHLVRKVFTMARQLQDSTDTLRKERTARKAMASAYQDLLSSHMRLLSLSSRSENATAAIGIGEVELAPEAAPPLPTDELQSADDLTLLEEEAVSDTPEGAVPARRRSILFVPGTREPSAEQLEVTSLLSAVKEYYTAQEIVTSLKGAGVGVSFFADGRADLPTVLEETESNALIDVFGLETAVLQRLVDASHAILSLFHTCASSMTDTEISSTTAPPEVRRSISRWQHLRTSISLPPASAASGRRLSEQAPEDTATVGLPSQLIMLSGRVLAFISAISEFAAAPPPTGNAPSAKAKAQIRQGINSALCLLRRLLIKISADVTLALNACIRLLTSSVAACSKEFAGAEEANFTTVHAPFGATDAAQLASLRLQVALVAQKAQIDWIKDKLVAAAMAPVWAEKTEPETAACARCGGEFSVLRRRHHCRCCGEYVCNACGPSSFPLQKHGISPAAAAARASLGGDNSDGVRVCNACLNILQLLP